MDIEETRKYFREQGHDLRSWDRYDRLITPASVAVVQNRSSGRRFYGSATAVFIGGRVFLATAAHNLNTISSPDQLSVALAVTTTRGRVLDFEQPLNPPDCDYPDVAWIEIAADALGVDGFRPLGLEDLDLGVPRHYPHRAIWTQGYPESQVLKYTDGVESLCSSTVNTTSLAPLDKSTEGGPPDTFNILYPPLKPVGAMSRTLLNLP